MNRILQCYKSFLRKIHCRSQVGVILDNACYDPALSITEFFSLLEYASSVSFDSFVRDDVFLDEVSVFD